MRVFLEEFRAHRVRGAVALHDAPIVERFGAGWLETLVREQVAAHDPTSLEAPVVLSPRARARRHLGEVLRSSGLRYGTPPKGPGDEGEGALFRAMLRGLCRIGLDVATLEEAAPGPRAEQLLLLLAATFGALEPAEDLHRRIERAAKKWPLPKASWREVEERLEARAPALAGDPYFGLVLHNGAVFADAQVFGRIALAYFAGNSFPKAAVERRVRFAAAQKALLVEVLVGLVCAERPPAVRARKTILNQVESLGLPRALEKQTQAFVRQAFQRPPPVKEIVAPVRSVALKHFILEQTVLASLVDGRRSAREVAWVRSLAKTMKVSPEELKRLEVEMAEFYARNRSLVDVFTVAEGADVMGEELVDSMQTALEKNWRRLMQELRETGELSVLLARAARGESLTGAEKKAMREQLIDVAKAIPALAIFAAPGGVLLLIALAKLLPFDLLPSAFRDEPVAGPDDEK